MCSYTIAEKNSTQTNNKYCAACLYLLFLVLMIVTISCKVYYYGDEMWSYAFANYPINSVEIYPLATNADLSFQSGMQLIPAKRILDYMLNPTVGRQFDYKQVLKNQALDTHPPLYYLLLHTICSFFPCIYSKWFAGIINILFAFLTLFVVRRLIRLFTDDEVVLSAISFVVALSSTMLNSVAFLRMYIMAMFWTTLYAFILICYVRRDLDKRFYISIFFITLLAALTHYYCILYFALSGAVFVFWKLCDKKYKQFSWFCLISLLSLAVAYAIFPAMAQHLLHGARGAEFTSNIFNSNAFRARMQLAFVFVNNELFGWLIPFIFLFWLVMVVVLKKKDVNFSGIKQYGREYSLIFLPVVIFLSVVTRTLPIYHGYYAVRYYIPIVALLLSTVLLLIFTTLKYSLSRKRFMCAVLIISSFVVIGSWVNTDWKAAWLYRGYLDNQYAQIYKDADYIQIGGNEFLGHAGEIPGHRSFTVFPSASFAANNDVFKSLINNGMFVINITPEACLPNADIDSTLHTLLATSGNTMQYSVIKAPWYSDTVYPGLTYCGNVYYISKIANR